MKFIVMCINRQLRCKECKKWYSQHKITAKLYFESPWNWVLDCAQRRFPRHCCFFSLWWWQWLPQGNHSVSQNSPWSESYLVQYSIQPNGKPQPLAAFEAVALLVPVVAECWRLVEIIKVPGATMLKPQKPRGPGPRGPNLRPWDLTRGFWLFWILTHIALPSILQGYTVLTHAEFPAYDWQGKAERLACLRQGKLWSRGSGPPCSWSSFHLTVLGKSPRYWRYWGLTWEQVLNNWITVKRHSGGTAYLPISSWFYFRVGWPNHQSRPFLKNHEKSHNLQLRHSRTSSEPP